MWAYLHSFFILVHFYLLTKIDLYEIYELYNLEKIFRWKYYT